MKNTIFIGIDVGNGYTKSPNTVIASSYDGPYTQKPTLSKHYLCLDGKYYASSTEPMFYQKDKTLDERGIILTLFSIAEEIISSASKKVGENRGKIQEQISLIHQIVLGAGLPVSHYNKKYVEKLISYYEKYMKNGISFEYDGYEFLFRMVFCQIYPQGGAAVACKEYRMSTACNTFYIVDIGSYTVDVVMFQDGRPSKNFISFELGIFTLFDKCVDAVSRNCDIDVDYSAVEDVLQNKPTILYPEVVDLIRSTAQKHAGDIINALRQKKILIDSHPSLFLGGGASLLQKDILSNPLIRKDITQFVKDTKANAKGYARSVRNDYKNYLLSQENA